MCDLDYVAALHAGWNGARRDQIATKRKTVEFLREVVGPATGNAGYERWAQHLYELYRNGLVHLRAPKVLRNEQNSPRRLGWALMFDRETAIPPSAGGTMRHLELTFADDGCTALLAISIRALFED